MRQSRLMSLVEAMANVAVGLVVALATQIVVFPILGLQASLGQNLKLALMFTGVSIVRGYALLRLFRPGKIGEALAALDVPPRSHGHLSGRDGGRMAEKGSCSAPSPSSTTRTRSPFRQPRSRRRRRRRSRPAPTGSMPAKEGVLADLPHRPDRRSEASSPSLKDA
jgi:hypothetical protein